MKINQYTSAAVHGQEFVLLPEKALFWDKNKTLILSDLHLGKINHFRKAGIAVPHAATKATLEKLEDLLLRVNPENVLLLGDLFHSSYNAAWVSFNNLIERYGTIHFTLIEGNHDILSDSLYENCRMEVIKGYLETDDIIFTHEPLDTLVEGKYNICGHLHPAIRMVGKARQSLRLPCFYFGDHTGILPSFGVFTGSATIQPLPGEQVYVVAKDKVIQVV